MSMIVRPQSARLLRETDSFGSMDPYVKVTIGSQAQTTGRGVGMSPVWQSEILTFKYNPGDQWIVIEVYDERFFGDDDLIGGGSCSIQKLVSIGRANFAVPIYYQSQPVGEVQVDFEYSSPRPPGSAGPTHGAKTASAYGTPAYATSGLPAPITQSLRLPPRGAGPSGFGNAPVTTSSGYFGRNY